MKVQLNQIRKVRYNYSLCERKVEDVEFSEKHHNDIELVDRR